MRVRFTKARRIRGSTARCLLIIMAVATPALLLAFPATAATASATAATRTPPPVAAKTVPAGAPHAPAVGARDFRGISARQSDLIKAPPGTSDGEGAALGNCDFGDICYAPPDVNVAAGTGEVIETVNCTIAGYSKTDGSQLWVSDIRTLFPGSSQSCTDPRLIFIPRIGRFALVYWDSSDSNGPLRFAVSSSPNPTGSQGNWYAYATPGGFLDQPKIVATQNTLILSADDYSTGAEQYYVYDLNQVAADTSGLSMQALSGSYLPAWGAVGAGYPPPPSGYFVTTGASGVHMSVISGDPASGNVSISYQTVSTQPIASPSEPAIPGGYLGGSNRLDNRVLSAAYEVQNSDSHPVIDFSGNTECNGNVCPYDIKLDLSTTPARIVKDLTIAASGQSYMYGSVALDNNGNAYMAYSRSDASDTPSANALTDDDSGSVGWNNVMQAQAPGTSACPSGSAPPCDEWWGDFFGAAQDPSNTSDVWLAAESQAGDGEFGWDTSLVETNSSGFVGG